jgi:hypothetical protein
MAMVISALKMIAIFLGCSGDSQKLIILVLYLRVIAKYGKG